MPVSITTIIIQESDPPVGVRNDPGEERLVYDQKWKLGLCQ